MLACPYCGAPITPNVPTCPTCTQPIVWSTEPPGVIPPAAPAFTEPLTPPTEGLTPPTEGLTPPTELQPALNEQPASSPSTPTGATLTQNLASSLDQPTVDGLVTVAEQPGTHISRSRRTLLIALATILGLVLTGGVGYTVWRTLHKESVPTSTAASQDSADLSTVKDSTLRAALLKAGDKDGDGTLTKGERLAVKSLTVKGALTINNVGKVFPKATTLEVTGGKATTVDVSDMPELTTLHLATEPVPTIDLSRNTKLTDLTVADATEVTGLDKVPGITQVWLQNGEGITRDENGRLLEAAGYSYQYDDAGRIASTTPMGDGLPGWEFTYNEDGALTSAHRAGYSAYGDWIPDVTRSFTYTPGGLLESMSDGTITTTFAFDTARRMTEAAEHEGSDRSGWFSRTVWTYADDGCMTSKVLDGPDVSSINYSCDDHAHVVKASDGGYFDRTITYDDHGNMTSVQAGGEFSTRLDLTYDEHGNLTSAQESGVSQPMSYTFTYTRWIGPADKAPVGLAEQPLFAAFGAVYTQSPDHLIGTADNSWPASLYAPIYPDRAMSAVAPVPLI